MSTTRCKRRVIIQLYGRPQLYLCIFQLVVMVYGFTTHKFMILIQYYFLISKKSSDKPLALPWSPKARQSDKPVYIVKHLLTAEPDISFKSYWRSKQSWKKNDSRGCVWQVVGNTNKYVSCLLEILLCCLEICKLDLLPSLSMEELRWTCWHHANIWPTIIWDILSGTYVNNYKSFWSVDCLRMSKVSTLNSIWRFNSCPQISLWTTVLEQILTDRPTRIIISLCD